MNIINAIQEYISDCPYLGTLTNGILVDWTATTGDYGIAPAGEQLITRYMDGGQIRQYNFILYAKRLTETDLERLENAEFIEKFSRWIIDNDNACIYPKLGSKLYCIGMSCMGGVLDRFDETGGVGTYKVQIAMTYEKE